MGVCLCDKGNSHPNILDLGIVRMVGCVMLLFMEHPDLLQLCKIRKQAEAASVLYTPFIFHTKFVCLSSYFLGFFLFFVVVVLFLCVFGVLFVLLFFWFFGFFFFSLGFFLNKISFPCKCQ